MNPVWFFFFKYRYYVFENRYSIAKQNIAILTCIDIFFSVTVHVFVPNRFGTGLSVRYACVPNEYSIYFFFSGISNNKWHFDSLWCGMTDCCINALESRFWDASETCWYNPDTSIGSSGSRVWAVTRRRLEQSGARVNAIIPSSVLLVLTRINMTEHLMPHVIAQSVFQPWKDINKTAWK